MNILVIGSEGNVGKELVPYLRNMDHTVYRVDIIQSFGDDYCIADIKNSNDLAKVFFDFKPEIVFNLAAMVSRVTCEKSKGITVDTNLSGVENVIQLCKMYNAKMIYFSTSEVYGNIGGTLSEERQCEPNNFYGLSKYLGEYLVKYEINNGLNALIIRPFMLYSEVETFGENRSAMIRFAENLLTGKKITVHKRSKRAWLHMSDAVVILERLMQIKENITINIGHQDSVGTDEIALLMCNKLGLIYDQCVIENELPEKMTLEKNPALFKQFYHSNYRPEINISEGIDRVLAETKRRLQL